MSGLALNAVVGLKRELGVAKVICTFNGTGTPAIRLAKNVSSITDNGVGTWTINFAIPFSSGEYAVDVSATAAGFGAAAAFPIYDVTATSSVNVLYGTVDSGGLYQAADRDEITVNCWGNQ